MRYLTILAVVVLAGCACNPACHEVRRAQWAQYSQQITWDNTPAPPHPDWQAQAAQRLDAYNAYLSTRAPVAIRTPDAPPTYRASAPPPSTWLPADVGTPKSSASSSECGANISATDCEGIEGSQDLFEQLIAEHGRGPPQ